MLLSASTTLHTLQYIIQLIQQLSIVHNTYRQSLQQLSILHKIYRQSLQQLSIVHKIYTGSPSSSYNVSIVHKIYRQSLQQLHCKYCTLYTGTSNAPSIVIGDSYFLQWSLVTSELSKKEYLNGSVWFICTNAMCTTYWTFSGWEWSSSVGGLN